MEEVVKKEEVVEELKQAAKPPKTEVESKVEVLQAGLARGPVTVRFDARLDGVDGIKLDEGEQPHRAQLKVEKDALTVLDDGLAVRMGDATAVLPWKAVWAIEGQGDGACGFFPKSCPPEHVQMLFMQCMNLRAEANGLRAIVESAIELVNRAASHGAWRLWRQKVTTLLAPQEAKKDGPRIVRPE